MNSTLETAAAVSAVVSAFHGGVDLVQQIRKRSKKRKSEQAIKEKLLQESLGSGEMQISGRYTQYFEELGTRFRVGDDIARDRLLHITVLMQSELIRSLQISLQYENAVLDLTKLQEDAVMNRRDTLMVLDELRNRLIQQSSPRDRGAPYMHLRPKRPSLESMRSYMSSHTVSPDFVPSGVTVPAEEEPKGLSRLLSKRRNSKRASISTATSKVSLSPNFDWLGPAVQPTDENTTTAVKATEYELPAGDVKIPAPEPDTNLLHPAMAKEKPITRHASTSAGSDFSDEKIPVLSEEDEPKSPQSPAAVDVASALPPQHHYRYPSSSTTSQDNSVLSPISTASTASSIPSPISIAPDPIFAFRRRSAPQQPPTSNRSSAYSSTSQHRNSSINMPPTLNAPLVGRPSKDNNYWGFCKGSWTIHEDWRKGLRIEQIPSGLYSLKSIWGCRWCTFNGEVYGAKKPFDIDQRVWTANESGVRYRWVFLAKSHVKKKAGKDGDSCFGCVFCVSEGKGTGIFGNVETLCNHLVVEHGSTIGDEMAVRNKCIYGRVAEDGEDFDVNIPGAGGAT